MMMSKMFTIAGKIAKKMNKSKALRIIIAILVAISILVYSLTDSIDDIAKDTEYYNQYSRENNIKDYAGIGQEDLEIRYQALIDYIYSGQEDLINDYFNQKEVLHMKDVHGLFELNSFLIKISRLLFYSFVIYNLYKLTRRYKTKFELVANMEVINYQIRLILAGVFILALGFLILAILVSTNFDYIFVKFHHIFFDNDLWLLDPTTDLMIRMLPQAYFMNLAKRIFFSFLRKIGFILIILFATMYLNKRRKDAGI